MATVKTISQWLRGVEYKQKITCNSKGRFSSKSPAKMLEKLNARTEPNFSEMIDVLNYWSTLVKEYNTIAYTYEMLIRVRFEATGKYHVSKTKKYGRKWDHEADSIALHVTHIVKEIGGAEDAYYTVCDRKVYDNDWRDERDPDGKQDRLKQWEIDYPQLGEGYTKDNIIRDTHGSAPSGIILPYSKEALDTLEAAVDNMVNISTLLSNFFDQDLDAINAGLSSGVLGLAQPKA